jgi:hypothetical protein
MSLILSLPEELIIEIMAKGDHRMLVACQRVSGWRRLFVEFLRYERHHRLAVRSTP